MIVITAAAALSSLAGGGMAAVGSPAPSGDSASFLNVSDITTPIFSPSGIDGSLSVSVAIQARDASMINDLREKMPELRAALLTTTLEFSRLYASGFQPVDAERLDEQLTAALQRVHPGAERALILKLSADPA
ncbi:hypothetical protein [Sphingobium boeckii]|uniref:Flagellar basal body-associated protein FliL n=1 Tax=Sphingobium boeckii TaxID=1082345 RepID=A0A7W9AGU6_9SPHN|nr:hypothetical protein [Sphingobium boeckii]MBB5685256.1 flagellar basal body-associated protein FliL [Sphingobium boeckii]